MEQTLWTAGDKHSQYDAFTKRNNLQARLMKLEDLTPGASVRGILPDATVTVVNVQWHGSE